MHDPAPWWWPQIARFWLALTVVYGVLTWAGRWFGLWLLTSLACFLLLAVVSAVAYVFIRGMDDVANRFPGRSRLISRTVVLVLLTSGAGCLTGYLLG